MQANYWWRNREIRRKSKESWFFGKHQVGTESVNHFFLEILRVYWEIVVIKFQILDAKSLVNISKKSDLYKVSLLVIKNLYDILFYEWFFKETLFIGKTWAIFSNKRWAN